MRLSEMPTEQFEDAVCDVAEAADKIMSDDLVAAAVETIIQATKKPRRDFVRACLPVIPRLLKGHRDDLHRALASLTGKTPEEIARQNIMLTLTEARDSVDEELIGFFYSPGDTKDGE